MRTISAARSNFPSACRKPGANAMTSSGARQISPSYGVVSAAKSALESHCRQLAYELLPSAFTLRQLQAVHEAVLGRRLNKTSFRRKVLASGELRPTGRHEEEVGHRPAELYELKSEIRDSLRNQGGK